MPQLVTRIDEHLAAQIDELVSQGVFDSRSDAVRRGLLQVIDQHHRAATARAIVKGYTDLPQRENEGGWSDDATIAMISDEPW